MITILVDHNLEGQATWLLGTLASQGWLDLVPLHMITLREAGLALDSSDRWIWRFVQERGMLLLTHNRTQKGRDSLEQTLREEVTAASLPVLTLSNRDRMMEREYREQCAERLIEIVVDLDHYRGVSRIFLP